jgi:glyoxylase-like metal-dependent hydrolase (beta-lactamase superfamily II)
VKIIENVHAFIWKSMSANNCNTYLIDGPTRTLIDPGHSDLFGHVEQGFGELGLALADIGLIICTHSHPDHIEAVQLFHALPTLVTLHYKEWKFVKTMDKYANSLVGIPSNSIAPDFFLKKGDISISGLNFRVFHTPGHSPGSISLYCPELKVLFTGDVAFKGGVGRTDLPGGDGSRLKQSIKDLSELEIEWLLPGHGDIIGGATAVKANFDQLNQFWLNYL